ncbi:hypothetical protein M0R45_021992 [Rubus argutus]|uniref:Uncharacterized protein n=1 Tax=Rubus argutus TaxID=59490 RepID=A0AAW1XEJ6_RUBAR
MYVTRPLSMYMRSPELLSLPPPEGPNSGYLVLQDEESIQTACFGMCRDIWVKQLPFPQNMDLTVTYTEDINDDVTFIPVLDQPLSSNTYYVKLKGSTLHLIRSRLPGLDFPLSSDPNDCSEAVVVGKWYCPFVFVKEGGVKLKEQMKRCVFYEMRLEKRWERIFSSDHEGTNSTSVFVDTFVPREVVFVGGSEAVWDDRNVSGGFMWFKSLDGVEGGEKSVGLSMKIVERMKWEQERVGWIIGDEKQVRVERVEEFGGTPDEWKKFACYVLVERFVLKRMHERLAVLAYDFKHTHQIRSKWE